MILLPKQPTLAALAAEYASVDALVSSLGPADWAAPSPCPGWDVRANLSHMIGTESALAGEAPPDVVVDRDAVAHIRNDIGASNERWVQGFVDVPPDELVAAFRAITRRRLDTLASMGQDEWDAEGPTPAGRDSYGRWMRIRVYDCWMHEQDIRDAVGRPGHDAGPEVELAVDEQVGALGYVVGKQAGAPKGSSVTFSLTGGAPRTIHVAVADRAAVVATLDGPATTTLEMPVGVFTRLGGGRVAARDVADQVGITGDATLGQAVLDHMAYTI